MNVRFFADWGPDGKSRTLIGISRPTDDRGEVSEAVRVATQEDQAAYPDAYAAYQATMQPAPGQPSSEQPAEAVSAETAEEGQSEEGSGRHRGRRSSSSEEG